MKLPKLESPIIKITGNDPCKTHNPKSKTMGYVEWHEWADEQTSKGNFQKQCKECSYFYFKCEM